MSRAGGRRLRRQRAGDRCRARFDPRAVRDRLPDRSPRSLDMVERAGAWWSSHGNGPQVGFILRRSELAMAEVTPVPVDYAVADTQGAIGYMFVKALRNELTRARPRRGRSSPWSRRSVVDRDDPAFAEPDQADRLVHGRGARQAAGRRSSAGPSSEDAGRGWRRTVPSPVPQRDRRDRTRSGSCWRRAPSWSRPAAAASRWSCEADGDLVGRGGGRRQGPRLGPAGARARRRHAADPHRRAAGGDPLRHARAAVAGHASPWRQARRYIDAGEFGEGSMEPKVAAIADFVEKTPHAVGVIGAAAEIAADPGRHLGHAHRGRRCRPRRSDRCSRQRPADAVLFAVNGTLMRGLKLNPNLVAAGATFVREATTEPAYRLWTINDDHPAMVRVTDGSGVAVAVEVWSVPRAGTAGDPARRARRPVGGQGAPRRRIRRARRHRRTGTRRGPPRDHRLRRMACVRRRAGATVVTVLGRQLLPDAPAGTVPFWRQVLRGCSQCGFQANEVTGVLFVAAAAFYSWRMAIFYVVSVVIATVDRAACSTATGCCSSSGCSGSTPA